MKQNNNNSLYHLFLAVIFRWDTSRMLALFGPSTSSSVRVKLPATMAFQLIGKGPWRCFQVWQLSFSRDLDLSLNMGHNTLSTHEHGRSERIKWRCLKVGTEPTKRSAPWEESTLRWNLGYFLQTWHDSSSQVPSCLSANTSHKCQEYPYMELRIQL